MTDADRKKLELLRRRLEADRKNRLEQSRPPYVPCRVYAEQWRNASEDALTMPVLR